MANKELAQYILEQLADLGETRCIPMMGGYIFYYRERIFGGIYDNGFLVKDTKAGRKYMPDSVAEPPYEGAKAMLPVTILEDRENFRNMVAEMYEELPERKVRKTAGDKKAEKAKKEKKEMPGKAFDYKKEYKEFYMPKNKPEIVTMPPMNYVAVRGMGDPNEPEGAYKKSIEILYAVAYAIKMSKMGQHAMDGYFDFVVPPLEGFWRQDGVDGFDISRKSAFQWISVIRLPDFVTKSELEWAKKEAWEKKKLDCSAAEFYSIEEGLCVQIMHIGSFDTEQASVDKMNRFLDENGYKNDFSEKRLHHEIYLSDARRAAPERWKTVIRHPAVKIGTD